MIARPPASRMARQVRTPSTSIPVEGDAERARARPRRTRGARRRSRPTRRRRLAQRRPTARATCRPLPPGVGADATTRGSPRPLRSSAISIVLSIEVLKPPTVITAGPDSSRSASARSRLVAGAARAAGGQAAAGGAPAQALRRAAGPRARRTGTRRRRNRRRPWCPPAPPGRRAPRGARRPRGRPRPAARAWRWCACGRSRGAAAPRGRRRVPVIPRSSTSFGKNRSTSRRVSSRSAPQRSLGSKPGIERRGEARRRGRGAKRRRRPGRSLSCRKYDDTCRWSKPRKAASGSSAPSQGGDRAQVGDERAVARAR